MVSFPACFVRLELDGLFRNHNTSDFTDNFICSRGTPSKFHPSQTPPYLHPHLLATGLLLAFAYCFAQTIPITHLSLLTPFYKMGQLVGLATANVSNQSVQNFNPAPDPHLWRNGVPWKSTYYSTTSVRRKFGSVKSEDPRHWFWRTLKKIYKKIYKKWMQ